MNSALWDSLRSERLQWLPELGIGWYPVSAQPYDEAYWENYRELDRSFTGAALTAMRLDLVAKHWGNQVVDIGIGGGRFLIDHGLAFGYDVNPHAVEWLKEHDLWCDPYAQPVDAITCWDVLEHIHDPGPLLANVRRFVFVSLPIFGGPEDVLASKHFKREEHCWYFTRVGLAQFMKRYGFKVIAGNNMEQMAGREQIESFVFERPA